MIDPRFWDTGWKDWPAPAMKLAALAVKRLNWLAQELPREDRLWNAIQFVIDQGEGHMRYAGVAWSSGDLVNVWDHMLLALGYADAGIHVLGGLGVVMNPPVSHPRDLDLDSLLSLIEELETRVRLQEHQVQSVIAALPPGHPLQHLSLDPVSWTLLESYEMVRARNLEGAYAHLQYALGFLSGIQEILARSGTMGVPEPDLERKADMSYPDPEVKPIFSPEEMQDLHNRAHSAQQALMQQYQNVPPGHIVRHLMSGPAPLADNTLEIADQSFFETLDWKWAAYGYIFAESIYKAMIELIRVAEEYDREQMAQAQQMRPAGPPPGFPAGPPLGLPAPGGPVPRPEPMTIPAEFGPPPVTPESRMIGAAPPPQEKKKRWWFFNEPPASKPKRKGSKSTKRKKTRSRR